jgi:hypothetical protein
MATTDRRASPTQMMDAMGISSSVAAQSKDDVVGYALAGGCLKSQIHCIHPY